MKCTNCGHEFEGKFCPQCGTPAVEYLPKCPNCGKERQGDEKFCTDCGYSFLPQPYAPKNIANTDSSKPLLTFYKLLPSIPIYAFALLSLLMFIIFLAPVISVLNFNVYEMLSDMPALIALIVLAVIGFLFAVFAVVAIFLPQLKIKRFTAGNITFSLNNLNTIISCVILLIYFIISCVICAVASSEWFGAGACPIIIMVFSLLIIMLAAAALVTEYLLGKKFPAFKDEAEKDFINQQKEIASRGEPVAPEVVEKPLKPQLNETEVTIAKYERFKVRSLCYFCLPTLLIGILSSVISCFFSNYKPARWDAQTKIKGKGLRVIFILGIVFMVLMLAVCAINLAVGYLDIKEEIEYYYYEYYYGNGTLGYFIRIFGEDKAFASSNLLYYLESFIEFIVSMPFVFFEFMDNGYIDDFYPELSEIMFDFAFGRAYIALIMALYGVIWVIVVSCRAKKYRKRLNMVFYGTVKPQKNAAPVCQYSDFNKEYLEKLYAYQRYETKKRAYISQKRKYENSIKYLNNKKTNNAV